MSILGSHAAAGWLFIQGPISDPAINDRLHALSRLTLWLVEHNGTYASAAFRIQALERLRAHVVFDRAIWGQAVVNGNLVLQGPALFNIPPHAQADYELAATLDPMLGVVLGAPETVHTYSIPADAAEPYRSLVDRLGVGHCASVAQFDRTLGAATGLVLLRDPALPPFSEGDRRFVEAAFGHLIKAWTTCQMTEALSLVADPGRPARQGAAVRGAAIVAADPGFSDLFNREWPDWRKPYVPAPLWEAGEGRLRPLFVGEHIVVEAHTAVDVALLLARERTAVDDLTAREFSVARLCAAGLSYHEIARDLGIAAATARNHVAGVHRRLGVKRNSEIGALLARAGRRDG